jgi:hypothetical protein
MPINSTSSAPSSQPINRIPNRGQGDDDCHAGLLLVSPVVLGQLHADQSLIAIGHIVGIELEWEQRGSSQS